MYSHPRLAAGLACGQTSGEKIESKGVIINRTDDRLTVKTSDGTCAVVLNSDTKVQRPVGGLGGYSRLSSSQAAS